MFNECRKLCHNEYYINQCTQPTWARAKSSSDSLEKKNCSHTKRDQFQKVLWKEYCFEQGHIVARLGSTSFEDVSTQKRELGRVMADTPMHARNRTLCHSCSCGQQLLLPAYFTSVSLLHGFISLAIKKKRDYS